MKNILILLLIFQIQINSFSQNIENYIDSIVEKINRNEVELYDINLQKIDNLKKLLENLTIRDTVTSCVWTRPRYIDNIYNGGFDGVVTFRNLEMDTSTHRQNFNFIEFKTKIYDKNDNFLYDELLFLTKRNEIKLRSPKKFVEEKEIDKDYQGLWKIKSIIHRNETIKLDSCHLLYRLELQSKGKFRQYYLGSTSLECATVEMEKNKEIGVEDEDIFDYAWKLKGHYLSASKGNWILNKNKNELVLQNGTGIKEFRMIFLGTSEYLKFKETDYVLELIKI